MNTHEILEKIGSITDKIDSKECEFEYLKCKYHRLNGELRDLFVERKKID